MSLHDLGDEDAAVVKIPAFAEGAGLLDIRRRVHEVAAVLPVLHPERGLVYALVLFPDAAQDFDEKAAAAARRVADGETGELQHERFGGGEIGLTGTDGFADLRDERAEQAGHQAVGHRRGDAGGRVENALVLAVGGEEHFVGLAKDVLVNAAVVVMDDAALERLAPFIHAEDGFEEARKVFEIFVVIWIEFVPDGALEKFGVVVVLKEFLKVFEELPDDAMRAFGLPFVLGIFPVVLQLAVAHQAVIFHRLGEDKLVQKLDDEFVVFGLVFETDGLKRAEPFLQLLEKRAVEAGTDFAVFTVANHVEQTPLFKRQSQQIGEGNLVEWLERLPDIAGAVKIGVAKIGQDEIFGMLEVFLNLSTMAGGFQAVAFEQVRAEGVKQRLEFDDDGGFLRRVQLEIHETRTEADLRQRGGVEENFRERAEQSFGGGFGFGSFRELIQIDVDGTVAGLETGIGKQRRNLNLGEVNQAAELL